MAKEQEVSKEQQIGFHRGSLATLSKEREELMRIIQVVEQLMGMHIQGLKDLGIDLAAEAKAAQGEKKTKPKAIKGKKDIADIL